MFRKLARKLAASHSAARSRRRARLSCEQLEPRLLMAVTPGMVNAGSFPADEHIVGFGDFDGDGDDDILFLRDDRRLTYWEMQDGARRDAHELLAAIPSDVAIVGLGDLDGDSDDDILYLHSDGRLNVWMMDNDAPDARHLGVVSPSERVAGLGDLNGDGDDDILFRAESGRVSYWEMDNDAPDAHELADAFPTEERVVGMGDLDGDGDDDILFRRDGDGRITYWEMQAGMRQEAHELIGSFPTNERIAGLGDLNGDGHDDILFGRDDGRVTYWDMYDGVRRDAREIAVVPSVEQIIGLADFSGTGHADVVFDPCYTIAYWDIHDGERQMVSNPGASKTLYLDFNGHFEAVWGSHLNVTGPAFDWDGNPMNLNAAEADAMRQIWAIVAEDFAPWGINVTTIQPPSFADGVALRVVIGGDWDDWYGDDASGVAYRGSFTDPALVNTSWAFDSSPTGGNYSARSIGDTVSHEAGHAFGLYHQSVVDENGVVTDEYRDGDSFTGPIMGDSDSSQRGLWANGQSEAPSHTQDDVGVLDHVLGRRADDHANAFGSANGLRPDGGRLHGSGIIERASDRDYHRFRVDRRCHVSFTVNVAQVPRGTPLLDIGNLDLRLELRDEEGRLIASAAPGTSLSASLSAELGFGNYALVVSSEGNYGDVGHYTMEGVVNNTAPVIGSIGNLTAKEGTESSLAVPATDSDLPANELRYELLQGPVGAAIDAASGLVRWTPGEEHGGGQYQLVVRVTDNGSPNLSAEAMFTIDVAETNAAPQLAAITDQQVRQFRQLKFTATATDADSPANVLAFSLGQDAPAGAAINPATGEFTWTPGRAHVPGSYEFTIRVTDDGAPALEHSRLVRVNVLAPPATKFYTLDGNGTFHRYEDTGAAITGGGLHPLNVSPRGANADTFGTMWVVDAKKVFVYDTQSLDLTYRGTWTPKGAQSPTGIATASGHVWIVDQSGAVRRYDGAASRTAGKDQADFSFKLNAANVSPQGIETDGKKIWVVDSAADAVFVYNLKGKLAGKWSLDAANASATGLTLDPTGASNSIWVVDAAADQVFEYSAGKLLTTGQHSAAGTFDVADPSGLGNMNPVALADPPAGDPTPTVSPDDPADSTDRKPPAQREERKALRDERRDDLRDERGLENRRQRLADWRRSLHAAFVQGVSLDDAALSFVTQRQYAGGTRAEQLERESAFAAWE